MPIPVLTLGFN